MTIQAPTNAQPIATQRPINDLSMRARGFAKILARLGGNCDNILVIQVSSPASRYAHVLPHTYKTLLFIVFLPCSQHIYHAYPMIMQCPSNDANDHPMPNPTLKNH